jgi:hypothetical protein
VPVSPSSSSTAPIPQGRLTLVSGTPVPTSDQTAKGTIYYDQYAGNIVPNYNGSSDANLTITGGEVSLVLDITNHLSGKVYDIFAIPNSTAVRLVTGPAWTSSTARSSALDSSTRGYITNASSITHAYNNSTDYGPIAANQGTYLGSFYCTANGKTGVMLKPTAAAGGSANIIGLFNAYNRVRVTALERDSTSSWTMTVGGWRVAHNNTNNSISFLDGLGVINTSGGFQNLITSSNPGLIAAMLGINLNSSSATPDVTLDTYSSGSTVSETSPVTVANAWYPALGYNTVYAMENINGTGTCTFNVDGTNMALTLNTEY